MTFWVVVLLLVGLAFVSGMIRGRLALPGRTRPALPEGATTDPLRERMRGLDAAIEEVRDALALMSPLAARACALTALSRRPLAARDLDLPKHDPGAELPASDTGPGTEIFERLLDHIARIDDADRRELVDAGLDPDKIIGVLANPAPPQRWERELSGTLDFIQQGLRRLGSRRYG